MTLTATVTSSGGTVNEGTETFTLLSGSTVLGTAVTVNVAAGAASASYSLPAGTAGGSYTIQAVYNGTANFAGSTDNAHLLTISAAGSTTVASNASALFSASAQKVTLTATVTSSGGTVNEGTETFTLLSGSTVVGTAVTVNVAAGAALASYSLPAGTNGGSYTIQASYNGTANYGASTDNTHLLTISAAGSSTVASNASALFSASAQKVTLSATVTSAAGTVNEGTETFTLLSGSTVLGTAVTVNVAAGAASASYSLPAGTTSGSYIIQASYNGTANFATSTDNTHLLTISAAGSSTVASNASALFSASAQKVTLTATVTSSGGTVNEGTETFALLSGSTVLGTAVTVNVAAGAASASYSLPAGTASGSYTIQASYNGTANYGASTDNTHLLTISAAGSTTVASNASALFSASAQNVTLSATVTSSGGTVNEGTETFTLLSGSTVVGTAVTVNVAGGAASASYSLPAGTTSGSYIIQASYNGTANFATSTDNTHLLTISAAGSTTVASNASALFSASAQKVTLTATVTSSGGTVNEGTETFALLSGSTVLGTAVTVNVAAGPASASYSLPAGTASGSYTIQASYNGTANFASSTDNTHLLTISAAGSTTVASNASALFSASAQNVTLTATVTSSGGTVNEGTETFTLLSGSTVLGTAVTVNVAAGATSASYSLTAGTAGGSYTIQAVYNGTANFARSTDNTHLLTISAAGSTTVASNASALFSASAQNVTLSATVTSAAGTVNEGTETFTLLSGSTVLGTAVTVNVAAGAASASYSLTAGTAGGSYTIQAVYNGTANFARSTDNTHLLTISAVGQKATPTLTWSNPANIVYGTALGRDQLNATASVLGTFTYTPDTGTVLSAGLGQTLSVTFKPTDTADYNSTSASVVINVQKATPALTWSTPADIVYGTALGGKQENATAKVPGAFVYSPAAGTMPLRAPQVGAG